MGNFLAIIFLMLFVAFAVYAVKTQYGNMTGPPLKRFFAALAAAAAALSASVTLYLSQYLN